MKNKVIMFQIIMRWAIFPFIPESVSVCVCVFFLQKSQLQLREIGKNSTRHVCEHLLDLHSKVGQ